MIQWRDYTTYQGDNFFTRPSEAASRAQKRSDGLKPKILNEDDWLYPKREAPDPPLGPLPRESNDFVAHSWRASHSLAGLVWFATGLGTFVDGLAVTISPRNYSMGLLLFWSALALVFAVYVGVLLIDKISRRLRQITVALIGVYPAVLYRMSSPLILGGFDEHLHERTLLDLLHGSGLFAPNSMLPVSPDYPGMELFTGAVVRLAGLPVMVGMSLVVLLCRLVFVLVLYNSALTVSPSHRAASLMVIFYAMSPQFYFFNSQYAYQTMALTLGLGGLLLLRRAQLAGNANSRSLTIMATLALVATVITHHITSWFVLVFLLAWTVATPRNRRRILVIGSVTMTSAVAVWTTPIFTKLLNYFDPVFLTALQQLEGLVAGTRQRKVFNNSAGVVTPEWQRAWLLLYAIVCTFVAVVCAIQLLRRALRHRDGRLGLLGFLCLGYPLTLAARFLPGAVSLGDRASTFFFLPLSLSAALVMSCDMRLKPCERRSRHVARHELRPAWGLAFILLAAVLYLGGVFVGGGPNWEYLPGSYLVSADFRSQDAWTIAAVRWAAMHLPPGSRVVADRIPADLLAGEAQQWLLTTPSGNLEPALLYFSNTWGPYQTMVVRDLKINYLYVDQRSSESLPQEGYYISVGETPKPERLTESDLDKFSRVRGLTAVYHRGPVTIYNTAGLGVKPGLTGFTGQRPMGLGRIGDGILGVAIVALAFAMRRKLDWLTHATRNAGVLGATIAVMAAVTLTGLALFGLRVIPGPSFTIPALVTAGAICIAWRVKERSRLVPQRVFSGTIHPLVILGIALGMTGLALSFHAAWTIDVADVDKILGTSIGVWNP
jgi:hypothetical protein